MKRSELEHIIRAAGALTRLSDFVVIGSQALLGEHPDAPEDLLASVEVDIYPKAKPEKSILIDGAIGEGSIFHDTFGYYAHGVGVETACLPEGWESRLVPINNENTGGATGWCLETHDLAVSKLIAGRPRDHEFVKGLLQYNLVNLEIISNRLSVTPVDPSVENLCARKLEAFRNA